MPVIGEAVVRVQHGTTTQQLLLVVIAGAGPPRLERVWLQTLHLLYLDWHSVCKVNSRKPPEFEACRRNMWYYLRMNWEHAPSYASLDAIHSSEFSQAGKSQRNVVVYLW